MAEVKPLYDPAKGVMRVAGFMSGKGTILRKVLEYQQECEQKHDVSHYRVVLIFTDREHSNAKNIAEDWGLLYEYLDIKQFCQDRNKRLVEVRAEYFTEVKKLIEKYDVDVIALGGFDLIISEPLLSYKLIINTHPADLSIMEGGRKKYIGLQGMEMVKKQMVEGEKVLRTSTHIVTPEVDSGELLLLSAPVKIDLAKASEILGVKDLDRVTLKFLLCQENQELFNRISEVHQDWLKEAGDWVVMPKTLEYIAKGTFRINENRAIYFGDMKIPHGLRLDFSGNPEK